MATKSPRISYKQKLHVQTRQNWNILAKQLSSMFTVRFWFYFVAYGTKYFESDQGAMKSQVYRYEKKKKKVPPSDRKLSLSCRLWALQQYTNPKHSWTHPRMTTSKVLKTILTWALSKILQNTVEGSWNMPSGERTRQTWDNCSRLFMKNGPKHLLWGAVVSVQEYKTCLIAVIDSIGCVTKY